jgi:hypothetical protein
VTKIGKKCNFSIVLKKFSQFYDFKSGVSKTTYGLGQLVPQHVVSLNSEFIDNDS